MGLESISEHSFCESFLQEHRLSTQESVHEVPNKIASSSDNKIAPLLGNPYFTTIMMKSNVQMPFQLVIPSTFQRILPHANVQGNLMCRGKTWKIRYSGFRTTKNKSKRFSRGWREFAEDNDLHVGDGCVFELIELKELTFHVQILDGQLPIRFLERI